ncbi:hypothetical protein COR50_01040 [Chitinophaga caeni]|uniref:Uncharacterized protein n=1 Tax=Chitinophaga caeni TaxID=2029983 RepID=A0A291QPJ6_9BACT|nr:tetratricopeptide repeat protein [Chitinophaga caeni]ATL45856.1 hypothetical protein COR50_01040 [Chitinophaga caeni]
MAELLKRAWILLEQNRFQEAINTLHDYLGEYSNDVEALYMLAVCYLESERYQDAHNIIEAALAIDPGDSRLHYLKARYMMDQKKYKDAELHISDAIAIDPTVPTYYATWSQLLLFQKKFQEALTKAEEGLSFNPEDETCLNLRSHALFNLDQKEAAFEGLYEALEHNPENAYTHANIGWKTLEAGNHNKALEHFREALRKDPNSQWAKMGMAQAMKAKYWLYRLYLKYSFFMSRQGGRRQWFIIGGVYLASRLLGELSIWLQVILFVIIASTWLITPISNLFLRMNPYGKFLLTKNDLNTAAYVGLLLATSVVCGITYAFTDQDFLLTACVYAAMMMIPMGSMNVPESKKGKNILKGITALTAMAAVYGIIATAQFNSIDIFAFWLPFILLFIYQVVTNILISRES